jgi:hypothetical protein
MRRLGARRRLAPSLLLLLVAVAGCGGGLELFLIPTAVRISPGLVTAAPGETVRYSVKLYSLFGTRIPSVDEVSAWTLQVAGSLPAGTPAPAGEFDPTEAGTINNSGTCEASPVVAPGTYRVGTVRAEVWGTWGKLSSHATLLVDGNIAENAPTADIVPQDLKLPPNTTVPFVLLSIDRESGRVASVADAAWSILEGAGTVDPESGLYTAPADKQEEVRVSAKLDTGRTALTYLSVVDKPAGKLSKLQLVPAQVLKVGIGRRQRFLAYGTDGDGRYIPASDAQWLVEGDIGALSLVGDGTAEFLARAAGKGAISVQLGGKTARQEIISVIPGA